MQTFLPYPDILESAKVLDFKRLGKQRVECIQLLTALLGVKVVDGELVKFKPKGWVNHPATKMWRGYEGALCDYGIIMCEEWRRRGYTDTCEDKLLLMAGDLPVVHPPWIGRNLLHESHRSNLLRKDPEHYSQFGWTEPSNLPYYWPI